MKFIWYIVLQKFIDNHKNYHDLLNNQSISLWLNSCFLINWFFYIGIDHWSIFSRTTDWWVLIHKKIDFNMTVLSVFILVYFWAFILSKNFWIISNWKINPIRISTEIELNLHMNFRIIDISMWYKIPSCKNMECLSIYLSRTYSMEFYIF